LYLLSKLVRQCGYKVVLTGEGADEMLGGYDIFKEYKIRRFCAAHADSTWRPLLLKKLYPYLKNLGSQPAAYLKNFFRVSSANAGDPFFSHAPRWRLAAGLKMFYSRGVRAELDSRDACRELEHLLPPGHGAWDGFSRAEYLEARHLLPGYILSSQGDRVAMAHAVEGRFPFLDYRVVEFAAGLPPTLKMKALQEKYLLKRCARGLVPPAVIRRHKQPYRAPEARSFFPAGRPLPYVEELLAPHQIRQDGIFDPDAVQKLTAKTRNGDIIGIRDNMALVGIISTTLLMRRFLTDFSAGEEQEEFHGGHPGRVTAICH
jgi:asparagine synthase (glutamine-hydrolysing)